MSDIEEQSEVVNLLLRGMQERVKFIEIEKDPEKRKKMIAELAKEYDKTREQIKVLQAYEEQ